MLREKYSKDEFIAYRNKAIAETIQLDRRFKAIAQKEASLDFKDPMAAMEEITTMLAEMKSLKNLANDIKIRTGTIYRLCFQLKLKPLDKGFTSALTDYNRTMRRVKRMQEAISQCIKLYTMVLKQLKRGEVYGDS